jgi:hypothetical protein
MTIYSRILSVPALAQNMVEQEKRDGQNSLWNNIGKLVALALNYCRPRGQRKRAMNSLEDYQIHHKYMSSDLSEIWVAGRQDSCVLHSLVDIQVPGPPALGTLFIH